MSIFESIFSIDGVVYTVLFAWLALAAAIEYIANVSMSQKSMIFKLSMVLLILILGLRWETGTDWNSYINLFYSSYWSAEYIFSYYSIDPGYVAFNALFRTISDNFTLFLIFNSIISMSFIYIFIKKVSPLPNISLFIFYTSYFLTHYMGSNRRILAIGLVLVTFTIAPRGRLVSISLLQAVAALFHRTSLIGLLSLLIPKKPISGLQVVGVLAIAGILALFQLPLQIVEQLGVYGLQFTDSEVVDKLAYYGENSDIHVSQNVNLFFQTITGSLKRILTIIFVIISAKYVKINDTYNRLANIYLFGTFLYISFAGSQIFQVLSVYYSIVEIGIIAIAANSISLKIRKYFIVALIAYGFLQMVSALNPYSDLYMPYISIFSEESRWVLY